MQNSMHKSSIKLILELRMALLSHFVIFKDVAKTRFRDVFYFLSVRGGENVSMAKSRSPDREKAENLYIELKGQIKLKDIADRFGIPEGTVRGWKNKDNWDAKMNGTFQKKSEDNTERSQKKRGAQPGNKNSVGHASSTPKGNKNAETHGFFSKYLPEETLELMEDVRNRSPLDILWDQIMIQYAAIIRSQKIMNVTDKEEMIKEIKKRKSEKQLKPNGKDTVETYGEVEYEFQFAWDRQATFLNAQSRAMTTLQSMIRNYDELLKSELATEEQKARIEVLKSKVPNKDKSNLQGQITALADLIKNPQERELIEDD